MKIIDLTHLIEEQMPVFPGTEQPTLDPACTMAQNGFREKKLTMYSHTGTHMDAPAHMLLEGKTLDDFAAEHFIGPACVIDARQIKGEISKNLLEAYQEQLKASDFVLLWTGWSEKWGKETYFEDFPALSVEAARYLSEFDLKGFGVDTISVDLMTAKQFQIHEILLSKDMVLIENLCHLDQLIHQDFHLSVLPIKLSDADGSPVRAVAMLL